MVTAITPAGQWTVRAPGPSFAPEGTPVADVSGRLGGRVVRVFGPVSRPYLSVRPRRAPKASEAAALIGSSVYREARRTDATG
ncbi:MAG: H/ACA RNA-protein complex component Gar1 [Thermoplasmata archaeon]|nr:H/ACA RNA-protein complex component Gar1 [Thermoplasmata archaeon]